jgi:Spy/CpxP family protein refolding chaperone
MPAMKPRIWTSTLALAATVLGLSAAVQAQPWMGQNPAHNDMRMMHPTGAAGHWEQMAKKLGLSSEQEGQIKALHEKQQAAMKAQREQSQQLQAERSAAWAAPTLDAARLESLRQQEVKQFEAMSKLRLEQQLALAKILTPAQRQQMAEKHKARQERRQDARKSHRAEHP